MSAMRCYLRVKKGHAWWDDWLIVAATAMDVVYMLTLWLKALDRKFLATIYRILNGVH